MSGRRVTAFLASTRARILLRVGVALAVLAAVVWRVGAEPFVRGLLAVDLRAVIVVAGLTALATVAASWRWRVIANRLGARISLPRAVAMYYRSQFLNTVLPGGVLGDVHRALAHGSTSGDVARASRAVAIERTAGQVVQVAITLVVVAFVGAEFAGQVLLVVIVFLVAIAVACTIAAASTRLRAVLRRELSELRAGIGSRPALAQVCAASVVVVACHVTAFEIAVVSVGAHAPALQLASLALVVLLGASIPLNVGGWGPREGVAGWAFATAGLGSAPGVAASTTFGVLTMIALAPGAVIAVSGAWRARGHGATRVAPHPAAQGVPLRVARPASVLTATTRGGRVS
jgi:uncharacterized membrane protein YbhN (UPF0104 family)